MKIGSCRLITQTLKRLPVSLRTKFKTLPWLVIHTWLSRYQQPAWFLTALPLAHSTPAGPVTLGFLETVIKFPNWQPLLFLFSMSRLHCHGYYQGPHLTSFRSPLKYHFLRSVFLGKSIWNRACRPITLSPHILLDFFLTVVIFWLYSWCTCVYAYM